MMELLLLLAVLGVLALTGFTFMGLLVVAGVVVLLGVVVGMLTLIIKLAPWLLLIVAICWLLSSRRKGATTQW